jgi:hypothetical protein
MPRLRCNGCNREVQVPDVDWTLRTRIAALREGQPRVAAARIRELTPLSLVEAEELVRHMTTKRGTCHGCGANLRAEVGECTRCRRLNVDWLGATDPL